MRFHDSRRVLQPSLQDPIKAVRQRTQPYTTCLLDWEPRPSKENHAPGKPPERPLGPDRRQRQDLNPKNHTSTTKAKKFLFEPELQTRESRIAKPELQASSSRPPSRPRSAMDDRNISIIQMQLRDVSDTVDVLKDLCNKSGYHVVKCEKQFDKISLQENGRGFVILRGASNERKLQNLERSLSRKGIKIEEPNLKLKDIVPNEYLLHQKRNCEKQPESQSKLMQNYHKFTRRRNGSIY